MADFATRMVLQFARLLEREAGHVLICLMLILIGATLFKFSIPKGEDLIVFALGALGRSLGAGKQDKP